MKAILILVIFIIPVTQAKAAPSLECMTFGENVIRLTHEYEGKHSEKAGKALLATLNSAPAKEVTCEKRDEAMRILERDSQYRQRQLQAGNMLAFTLSFQLLKMTDGGFAESLDIDLGNTIEKHAEKFLRSLKLAFGETQCDDGLVGNTGEYDEKSDPKVLQRRRKALQGVKEKDLTNIQRACLVTLERLLKKQRPQ